MFDLRSDCILYTVHDCRTVRKLADTRHALLDAELASEADAVLARSLISELSTSSSSGFSNSGNGTRGSISADKHTLCRQTQEYPVALRALSVELAVVKFTVPALYTFSSSPLYCTRLHLLGTRVHKSQPAVAFCHLTF
jgi:hypothetical protein